MEGTGGGVGMLGQKSDQVGLEHIVQDAEKSVGGAFPSSWRGVENRLRNSIRSVLHARHNTTHTHPGLRRSLAAGANCDWSNRDGHTAGD